MNKSIDQVFVIGGGTIYKEALESSLCTKIFFTAIENDLDTFFPIIPANKFRLSSRSSLNESENGIKFRFEEYCSIPTNEVIISSTINNKY
jgi:dihydrofolate reductase